MSLWLTHPLLLPSLIVGVTIVLWATSLLPEFITALLFFTAAMTARIAPPEVIFGGFASSAFWLVFSGFVLGVAIRKTGLADRAARALSAKLTDSWVLMVASVVLLSYALAFVMPSNMGRIALLMPIVAAMAKRAGIADGSRAWFGLALAVGFGTFQLSATILPANVPNLVMSGAAEGSYGIHLNYVPYLLLHTPVLGILKGLILIGLICWLFPAAQNRRRNRRRLILWGGMKSVLPGCWRWCWGCGSRRAGTALGRRGRGWRRRSSLCCRALALSPGKSFLRGEHAHLYLRRGHSWAGDRRDANRYRNGRGRGVASHYAAGCRQTVHQFPGADRYYHGAQLHYDRQRRSGAVHHAGAEFSDATGFPLLSVIMIQVLGYSTPLLPYQASPIVVAMGLGKVPARAGMVLCLALAIATYLVLLPLDYLWFSLLGKV
jgi:di/tricarboxylate transporter